MPASNARSWVQRIEQRFRGPVIPTGGKLPPSPKGDPLLGHTRAIRSDPLGLFLTSMRTCGDVVQFHFPGIDGLLLTHPDHVRYVLQEHSKNFSKATPGFNKLRLLLGNGLVTSEGSFWLRQRRIAQPAFHRQRIAGFAEVMSRATLEMLPRWEAAAQSGTPLDIAVEMNRVTLRIAGETLLSTDVSAAQDVVGSALAHVLHDLNDRITRVLDPPQTWPTPGNVKLQRAIKTLDAVVLRVIADRRRNGNAGKSDLLAMLMDARDDETGEAMSDQQLRDEVMTIFVAGHETTANALSWSLYLLSINSLADRKLRAEVRSLLGSRAPTLEDLPRLPYARMVIQESMRLYPPAWIFGRVNLEDDEIGGYFVPRGTHVMLSPYATHRHPAFWENPEGFDPERFAADKPAERPPFAYFPFGGGPRLCIGNNFAMMEAQLMLATIVQRFRLALVPGHVVEPEPLITMRPRYGLMMTLDAAPA